MSETCVTGVYMLYANVHVGSCTCAGGCVYVCDCGGQRSMSRIFLNHSPLYLLRWGSQIPPEHTDLARLAS